MDECSKCEHCPDVKSDTITVCKYANYLHPSFIMKDEWVCLCYCKHDNNNE